jgi:hypothetical protein
MLGAIDGAGLGRDRRRAREHLLEWLVAQERLEILLIWFIGRTTARAHESDLGK